MVFFAVLIRAAIKFFCCEHAYMRVLTIRLHAYTFVIFPARLWNKWVICKQFFSIFFTKSAHKIKNLSSMRVDAARFLFFFVLGRKRVLSWARGYAITFNEVMAQMFLFNKFITTVLSLFRSLSIRLSLFRMFICFRKMLNILSDIFKRNKLIIFSATYCPYCNVAKSILNRTGFAYQAIELDIHPEGKALLGEISKFSGIKTVPQLFLVGKFIGDCSTVKRLNESGDLLQMFKDHQVPLADVHS